MNEVLRPHNDNIPLAQRELRDAYIVHMQAILGEMERVALKVKEGTNDTEVLHDIVRLLKEYTEALQDVQGNISLLLQDANTTLLVVEAVASELLHAHGAEEYMADTFSFENMDSSLTREEGAPPDEDIRPFSMVDDDPQGLYALSGEGQYLESELTRAAHQLAQIRMRLESEYSTHGGVVIASLNGVFEERIQKEIEIVNGMWRELLERGRGISEVLREDERQRYTHEFHRAQEMIDHVWKIVTNVESRHALALQREVDSRV